MALTAISGATLQNRQFYRFEDFVGTVPGLTLVEEGALGSQLVIRGISDGSTGSVNAAVATYVDETPYTAVGPFSGSVYIAPDVDTFDMQRVEILKGPQGTLYGANAMGGLLKYVTNAPDPNSFSGAVEVGGSSVDHGGNGYEAHAMVNLPISTAAALRLVGYENDYPGFIDDPARGVTDINSSRVNGGRIEFLLSSGDSFVARLTALYQDRSWGDYFDAEYVSPGTLTPVYGPLTYESLISEPGFSENEVYNATLTWRPDGVQVVSATSYAMYHPHTIWDATPQYGGLATLLYNEPLGSAVEFDRPLDALTQEIRVSSAGSGPMQWLLGGYLTNQRAYEQEGFLTIDLANHDVNYDQAFLSANLDSTYKEYAGFVNLDFHATKTLDVSLGGRYSTNRQTFHEGLGGILGGGTDFGYPSSQNVWTYSGDVRWRPKEGRMLYARVADGYEPGGPNDVIPTASGLPLSFNSSILVNYEVGTKDAFLDRRLAVDFDVFHLAWRRIQLIAVVDNFATITNGATAESDGAELSVSYVPTKDFKVSLNGAYTDARLTENTPSSVNGHVGDRLPGAPRWEGSIDAQYSHPIVGEYMGILGATWSTTGQRTGDFVLGQPRPIMPEFRILDVRAGIENSTWGITTFVKNVANSRAINYVTPGASSNSPQTAVLYTPRTIGVTAMLNF